MRLKPYLLATVVGMLVIAAGLEAYSAVLAAGDDGPQPAFDCIFSPALPGAAGTCHDTPTNTPPDEDTPTPTNTPTHTPTNTPTNTPTDTPTTTPTGTPTGTPTDTPADTPTSTATNTPEPGNLIGDVNKNGEINAIDAQLILQAEAGFITLVNQKHADTNVDGGVDSRDATLILQFVAGRITGLPPVV